MKKFNFIGEDYFYTAIVISNFLSLLYKFNLRETYELHTNILAPRIEHAALRINYTPGGVIYVNKEEAVERSNKILRDCYNGNLKRNRK